MDKELSKTVLKALARFWRRMYELQKEKTMEQKPSIGRIVHYVLPNGPRAGEHRAAMITGNFGTDICNLTVYLDHPSDFVPIQGNISFTLATAESSYLARAWSAHFDDSEIPVPGTWHWPERV